MAGAGLFILVIGFLTVVTFLKGNTSEVASQLEQDLFGQGSTTGFLLWVGAIVGLAVIGSVLHIPRASKLFILLVLVVYVLRQPGLWQSAVTQLSSAQPPAASPANTAGVGQAETATGMPQVVGSSSAGGAPKPSAKPPTPSFPSWFPSNFMSLLGGH